jgi:hypothetical protein
MNEPVDPDLADCLDHFYVPSAKVLTPRVKFRPAIDELDSDLLRAELGDSAVAYLRDCYRRLGS